MANRFLSNIRINDAYTFPASDGSSGQVITTDGSGNLSFSEAGTSDAASVIYRDNFTGDGSTVSFDLQNSITDEDQTQIYIDGVYQEKDTYSVSGSTITFTTAPISGHSIEVISISAINTGPTIIYQDNFTGNGSATDFTLANAIDNEVKTLIFLNGVYQFKNTYSVDSTTLSFDAAPANGVDIEVISIASATQADSLQAGSVIVPVKNTHNASISKGTPVYISGNVGNSARLQIAPADASNSAKMPAAGLLLTTLAVNAEGYAITGGYLRNITTDTIDGTSTTSNDTVYVKAGGGLTMTKPTGSNLIQNIAKIARSSSGNSGSLLVSSILRTNDIPNIANDHFWLGNSSSVATATSFPTEVGNYLTTNSYATENYVDTEVAGLVASAPTTLDTLNELAAALGDDPNFATTTANSIGTKLPLAGGTLTGGLTGTNATFNGQLTVNPNATTSVRIGTGGTNAGLVFGAVGDELYIGANNTHQIRCKTNNDVEFVANATFAGNITVNKTTGVAIADIISGDNYSVLTLQGGQTGDAANGFGIYSGYPSAGDFTIRENGVANYLTIAKTTGNATFAGAITISKTSSADLRLHSSTYSADFNLISGATGANKLGIYDNNGGAYRLIIDSSGNIGIGTTPKAWTTAGGTKALQISTRAALWEAYNGTYLSNNMYYDGGEKYIESDEAAQISLGGDGTIYFRNAVSGTADAALTWNERMRIDSSGNVGIGITNPDYKLDVAGNFRINEGSAFTDLDIKSDRTSGNIGGVNFVNASDAIKGQIYGHTDGSVKIGTGGTSVAMVLDSSGNVGIGTTTPSSLLHLESTTGSVLTLERNDTYLGAGNVIGDINFDANVTGTTIASIKARASETGTTKTYLRFDTNDGSSTAERMRITSGGNVEIASGGKLTLNNTSGNNWSFLSFTNGSLFLQIGAANLGRFDGTSGAYTAMSDVNKKKDFEDSKIGLKEVMELQPKLYRMKEDAENSDKLLGFIAQEVKESIPQAYVESGADDNKFIGLNQMPIIAALTKSIQELKADNDSLKARIETLENN
jgi:hypothetical protein